MTRADQKELESILQDAAQQNAGLHSDGETKLSIGRNKCASIAEWTNRRAEDESELNVLTNRVNGSICLSLRLESCFVGISSPVFLSCNGEAALPTFERLKEFLLQRRRRFARVIPWLFALYLAPISAIWSTSPDTNIDIGTLIVIVACFTAHFVFTRYAVSCVIEPAPNPSRQR